MKNFFISCFAIVLVAGSLTGCNTAERKDAGMVIGGVAGGLAGSALTGGSTAGTIAGAVGGGFVGRELAH